MSYNRYRKRDKSEINRKSEIGLERVENYDSSDISENVIHHVRDYLYTPLYLDIDLDRNGSYGIVKFLESGHTMFITSLCKASGSSRQVYDTISGSLIYDKPTDKSDISDCPINFKVLGNYDTSPILADSTITVTVIQERLVSGGPLQIVTYVGIRMDKLSPFGKHGIRFIGTNLHDYTLGAVDYVNNTDPYDANNSNILAQWVFKLSDQIKKDLLAVPLYSEAIGDYVYAANGENFRSGAVDTATINGVPFCGVYDLKIDGKDARHINVTAKHSGSALKDAGEHQWEVLKSYPYLKYSRSGKKYYTINDLSGKNSLTDKGGLCYLSDFDNSEEQNMDSFLGTLGYWTSNKKDENLSISSVITVGILKKFWSILEPLLDTSSIVNNSSKLEARIRALETWQQTANDSIKTINKNIKTLQDNINALSDRIDNITVNPVIPNPDPVIPVPPDPVIPGPTEVSRYIDMSISKGSLGFSSPSGSVSGTIIPTSVVYKKMSDSTINRVGYTSTLMYSWGYNDAPIRVKVGTTTLSSSDYKSVGELNGSKSISITLTDPTNTPTFSSRELTLYTKYTYGGNDLVAQTTIYISYFNGNTMTSGALIDSEKSHVYLNTSSGTSTAPYYSIGSTVEFHVSAEDFINSGNTVHAYINQVLSINGILDKDSRYPIVVKNSPSSNFNITEDTIQGQAIWSFSDSNMPDPGVDGYSRSFDLYYDSGRVFFMRLIFKIGGQEPYLKLSRSEMTFGSDDNLSQSVTVSSNFPVFPTSSHGWITYSKTSDTIYEISVSPYADPSSPRTGSVKFYNTAGLSKDLEITQNAAGEYIYVVCSDNPNVTPGSNWSTTCSTSDAINFEFSVVSNISFDVYFGKSKETLQLDKNYSSTAGLPSNILISIPGNQTYDSITYTIKVQSSLNPITLQVTVPGKENKPSFSPPWDCTFHKENAFDILRTEKIVTVSCKDPDKVTLSVSDDDMVAKIYGKDYNKGQLYVHCYPRTVKYWASNKSIDLSVYYDNSLIGTTEFTIEATTLTVGTYFNVSSTIESFVKNDVSDQTIKITAFSVSGILTLTATDNRSRVLNISDKRPVTSGGITYNEWDVIIPKGRVPASKTPWTLTLTNACSQGSFVKYISIYEASDVAWDTAGGSDFQLTAFGHLTIADGCEIMPIVYERRSMRSYIGTNDNTGSTSGVRFLVPCIVHDLSRVSIGSSNYWSLSGGLLKYSTCNNCGQISGNTNNAITASLNGVGSCSFSNSMDTNWYNGLGLSYTSVYGSEIINVDDENPELSRYALLPSSKSTINPICIRVKNPAIYATDYSSPNFFPVPPDWRIFTSLDRISGAVISHDGYLNLEVPTDRSFTYYVNSNTNWGDSSTYPNGGIYRVSFRRSEITVIDEVPSDPEPPGGDEPTPTANGTVIYDQQDPNNNNLLKWSGLDLFTSPPGNEYQPSGSRCYLNSSRDSVYGKLQENGLPNSDGLPNNSQIITNLNLTLNCANIGKKFDGTNTDPGSYSISAFNNAKIYDLENSKIWDSQETFSGWNNLHSKNYRATFLNAGIGYSPIKVRSTRGISVYTGIAGVCSAASNDKADFLMYVPYVRVIANTEYSNTKISTDYFLVKYGQRFGLGFTNARADDDQELVECSYQLTRTVVNPYHGYYKYNVKISSDSGITVSSNKLMVPSEGIPNLLLDESTGMNTYTTNGTLDFEITHEDFCNIISYHITSNGLLDTKRADNIRDNTPKIWYFHGEVSGFDSQVQFCVQPFSWLRDLKVTIKSND